MLPDLAAIARVRLARPGGELGRGVAFHHACDAVFHASDWFCDRSRALRIRLTADGVDDGPARACAHAGLEMLLDGALVADPRVAGQTRRAFGALAPPSDVLGDLAPPDTRDAWRATLGRIGTALDPKRYADPRFIAERLLGMTAGRRRIELRAAHVDRVADALAAFAPVVVPVAAGVVASVRAAALADHAASESLALPA